MFFTISTTHRPATDLGYLLHKHPDRVQCVSLSFGEAVIFYPEASEERCTMACQVELDPVKMVRGRSTTSISHYVNDRPWAASSFLSVALSRAFGTALNGNSRERAELADSEIPLEALVAAVPCRGDDSLPARLFEPLGYQVELDTGDIPVDDAGIYRNLTLRGTVRLSDLLTHLYVLIPVLDRDKHYWIGRDEVDKLLSKGDGWLSAHPEQQAIVSRYLEHRRHLTSEALERLREDETESGDTEDNSLPRETRKSLHEQRHDAVVSEVLGLQAESVLDLGCADGKLLKRLAELPSLTRIVGVDASTTALQRAVRRLNYDRRDRNRDGPDRLELLHGTLTYRDDRLHGFDVACVVEVVEHLEPHRLETFARVLFAHTAPQHVILTTPNRDYNALFPGLAAGKLRHRDHRFEWSREEFRAWAEGVANRFGFSVRLSGIGPADDQLGAPSQMAVFSRDVPGKEPS